MCLIGYLATSQTMFLVAFSVCILLGALQVPVTYVKAIAGWYRERLGLALGTAMLFGGIGVGALPSISAWLISLVGWRTAYAYLGVLVSGVNLLSVTLLMREPRHADAFTHADRLSSTALLRMSGQLLRSPAFGFLATTFFFVSVMVGAGTWALPIVLNDRGLTAQSSSSIMLVVGGSMTAARFFFGILLDRVDPQRLSAVVFALASVGIGMLAVNASVTGIVIAGVLVGVALGSEVDAMAFLSARVFGAENLGVVYGVLGFCFSLGLGCGPAVLSIALRISGTYGPGFAIAAIAGGIASACVILAPLRSDPSDCLRIPV